MKTDTKRTKQKPRARRMWANYYPHCPVPETYDSKSRAMSWATNYPAKITVPVAVIPLDDPAALVEKATAAFLVEDRKPESWTLDDCMTAALTAIGVLPKQRKGGAK